MTRERDDAIIAARAAGATYGALAREHGVSRARVQQICSRHKRQHAWREPGLPYRAHCVVVYLCGLADSPRGEIRLPSRAHLRALYQPDRLFDVLGRRAGYGYGKVSISEALHWIGVPDLGEQTARPVPPVTKDEIVARLIAGHYLTRDQRAWVLSRLGELP